MATVNNVVVANTPALTSIGNFNAFWYLTRAIKKAGWKYKGSGDGTSKNTSSDPAADLWNQTPGTVGTSVASGAAAAISAPSRGRATVTGLSGVGSVHKGMFLLISGSGTSANNNAHQIEEVLSATSVRIDARNFAVAADAGPLAWSIRNPLGDTYPAGLTAPAGWWCGEGASILKIPITAAPIAGPSGNNFLKGENVTQASTGAEGEILGWVYLSGAGYLVIAPRLRGTGSGAHGWDTTNVITGDVSGATVTQVGSALEYRHQVVIWKAAGVDTGTIFTGSFEPVGESAEMFSTLMAAAGCTALIPPGGGGTGNAFPAHGVLHYGQTTSGTHSPWRGPSNPTTVGNSQVFCADALEEENYTADGTWNVAVSMSHLTGSGNHVWFSFMRMDDPEDGDVDPYICIKSQSVETLYTNNRTSHGIPENSGSLTNLTNTSLSGIRTALQTTRVLMGGWMRRGLAGEMFNDMEFGALTTSQTLSTYVMDTNNQDPARVQTAPTVTKVLEPLMVLSVNLGRKTYKGACKWGFVTQGGNGWNLYNEGTLIQLNGVSPAVVAGPWDGVSVPFG